MINDFIEFSGNNSLSQKLNEQRRCLISSLSYDSQVLADNAGVARISSKENYVNLKKLDKKFFSIRFQAKLPNNHEHFWMAEIKIEDIWQQINSQECINECIEIPISIFGGNHKLFCEGTLNFGGLYLQVSNSMAKCTLKNLREILTTSLVSFSSPELGGIPVLGCLSF